MKKFNNIFLTIGIICITNTAYAQYTGPELKMPISPGGGIICTVESGGSHMWNGIDIYHTDSGGSFFALDFDDNRNPGNESVLAAADGIVSHVVRTGCSKNGIMCQVQLDHGNGYVTRYFHQVTDTIPEVIQVGVSVNRGDFLGIVGTTGISDGTHLHFDVQYNGESKSYTPQLQGVTLEGIPFVDYIAGQTYQSTNEMVNTPTPTTSTFCNGGLFNTGSPNWDILCDEVLVKESTGYTVPVFYEGENIIFNAKYINVHGTRSLDVYVERDGVSSNNINHNPGPWDYSEEPHTAYVFPEVQNAQFGTNPNMAIYRFFVCMDKGESDCKANPDFEEVAVLVPGERPEGTINLASTNSGGYPVCGSVNLEGDTYLCGESEGPCFSGTELRNYSE